MGRIRFEGVVVATLIVALSGCHEPGGAVAPDGPEAPDASTPSAGSVRGVVEKGPFTIGAAITVQELDAGLAQTGRTFSAMTEDDFGTFRVDTDLVSPYAQVIASGFYFDEVNGALSSAPTMLRVTVDLTSKTTVNVNLLTYLQSARLSKLTQAGISFQSAYEQSRAEVLAIFNIHEAGVSDFDQMTIAMQGDSNAMLLAASAILMQAAVDRATSPELVAAELSDLLAKISSDIAPDGLLDDQDLQAAIRHGSMDLNLASVRSNLELHYSSAGAAVTLPPFEDYIDHDGDGLLNRFDYSLDFDPVSTKQLATSVTSNELPVKLYGGPPLMATITSGTLLINGVDTGNTSAQVKDGDTVAIRLLSDTELQPQSVSKTSSITIGLNHGQFTLGTHVPQPVLVSAVADPTITGQWPVMVDSSLDGKWVFGASYNDTLGPSIWSVNVSNPTLPIAYATSNAGTDARHQVRSLDGKVLVTHVDHTTPGDNWIRALIFDISTPASPVLLSYIPLTGTLQSSSWLSEDHGRLYVTHGTLQIWDISNLGVPAIMSTLASITPYDITLLPGEQRAVVATSDGICVVDVSNPAAPVVMSTFHVPGAAPDAIKHVVSTADGRRIYGVGDRVYILDYSVQSAPSLLGVYGNPSGRIVSGGLLSKDETLLYVGVQTPTGDGGGIEIVGVLHPSSPMLLGQYVPPPNGLGTPFVTDIALSPDEKYAYLAGLTYGMQILNLDP